MTTPITVDTAAETPVRVMSDEDAAAVLAIYQYGLNSGLASFETEAPTWRVFDAARLPAHRHVAIDAAGTVIGWVAASQVSVRPVYAGVVEHSLYIHPDAQGRVSGGCCSKP